MLRLLEKLSWHYAGLELLAHGAHKCGGMTLSEPRKHRGAETTRFTIDQRVLASGGFAVVLDLCGAGLTNVDEGRALVLFRRPSALACSSSIRKPGNSAKRG
jgi:hypothetical protein